MTNATTNSTPFAPCDHVDHHLFAVQPDIPLIDALEHATVYLNCAEALAHQAPTATRPEHSASLRWASQQMLVTARSLVQASVDGLHAAQAGDEA
ncbi:DUF3077 domain-containing protein [Pseudomonas sp. 10S4]|uniref:DUF3077 domain-containing protein n=1 Tax=Pseudomonas sp. 10S4 TaxID=3048583 RepID=UPI002AC90A44|nr:MULTISPECIES: DUF3077 domain-containing protein [unclassified Pseudomonas]MEB0223237.1 DUF3077 domain-containing protein [Pseudomonas sp. 5S1]MEB0294368.1 DUF3077 domain-containing protein [Pseudomonas sp. 10S4]WPX18246.1 DUF3077 domain-containing protein [Pseudomonas sp. 10S4]